MSHPVVIVNYDPDWPTIYDEEKREILKVIGHMVWSIEHVGSTSVPGLGAKPIIDIIVGVDDEKAADECVRILADIGYDDITPQSENPEWYYCIGKRLDNIYYHLHLVKDRSAFWENHILFRDYLRGEPDMIKEYYELKKSLAEKFRHERLEYNLAKTEFITSIVNRAREKLASNS